MLENSYETKEQVATWHKNRGPAHSHLEKPAMKQLMPKNLHGKKVLAAGCGLGDECHFLRERGAKVIGIDISEEMIRRAKELNPNFKDDFSVNNIEDLSDFNTGEFDFIYSSLVIHYCEHFKKPLGEFYRVLNDIGQVVISTHHPLYWGAESLDNDQEKIQLMGYQYDKLTKERKLYGNYLEERKIHGMFQGEFSVQFYHKTIGRMTDEFIQSGFRLVKIVEPKPIQSAKHEHPKFYETAFRYPLFILFHLAKVV